MSKSLELLSRTADGLSRRRFMRAAMGTTAAVAGTLAGSKLTVLASAKTPPPCPYGTHPVNCCCLVNYTSCCSCCGCGCNGQTAYAWFCTDSNGDWQCYECPNSPMGHTCSSANWWG